MKPVEVIVRQGKPKFSRKTVAKSMRGWITGFISTSARKGNTETEFIMREVLNAYNYFHPERVAEVEIERWKGKSSFEIIDLTDKVIVIKYQKKEKGEVPTRISTNIQKQELKTLLEVIRNLSKEDQENIKTKQLAKGYYMSIGEIKLFDGNFWKNFFSNRKLHNKFTLMLGVLDRIGLIEYKGGKTTLKDSKVNLQFALDSFI